MRRPRPLQSLAGPIAGTRRALRRGRGRRAPRIRLHDSAGHLRTLDLDAPEAAALLDAARRLLDAAAAEDDAR
jgi:hypothetical protein